MNDVVITAGRGGHLLGALVNLNSTGKYTHWGFVQLSYANVAVILVMVVIFLLAIFLPFPGHRKGER